MATDLSMVFADGDAAKETAATPSANMALAETEDMEDEDLLEDEDDEAQRTYKLQLPVVSVSIVICIYVEFMSSPPLARSLPLRPPSLPPSLPRSLSCSWHVQVMQKPTAVVFDRFTKGLYRNIGTSPISRAN